MKIHAIFCFFCSVMLLSVIAHKNVYAETQTISASSDASFAIRETGELMSWGGNFFGQLGDGTTTDRYSPLQIMEDVIAVSAGDFHALAIKSDNSLWAWGDNRSGQLGDGTNTDRLTPVKIMEDVVAVSAGGSFTMAIRTDGSLWAWGWNYGGALGDGTRTSSFYPIKIMEDVIAVSAGSIHATAIRADGSLWAWGIDESGRLGDGAPSRQEDGSLVVRHTPVKIMEDVVAVSAGQAKTMAIRTDGSLWAWGTNIFGIISCDTVRSLYFPVKIMEDVAYVSAGSVQTMIIKNDGSLWGLSPNISSWEDNITTIDRQVPVKVTDSVIVVSTGGSHFAPQHTLAIRADGNLWSWGLNEVGQLGHELGVGLGERGAWDELSEVWELLQEPKKIMDSVMLPGGATPVPLTGDSVPPVASTLRFTVGSTDFLRNGTTQQATAAPFISQGRTMIPLRVIAEALGAAVDWDDATQAVTIIGRGEAIRLIADVPLPGDMGSPVVSGGVTFVPVRYVSETLGAIVRWDDANNAVYIYE